jgi:hypothetical protein
MVTHTEKYQKINEILKEWNPIGVPESVASDEYSSYIPQIIERINNNDRLLEYLEDLLINVIGVEYNPKDKRHKQDVINVIEKINNL